MLKRILARYANRTLRRDLSRLQSELAEVRTELDIEQRKTRVQQAEIDSMAAVIARDRERIKAEAATAIRQRLLNDRVQRRGNRSPNRIGAVPATFSWDTRTPTSTTVSCSR